MIFECAFDNNQVLLLQVLAFLKRSKVINNIGYMFKEVNFITMKAIYIPVSKYCDSSCYKVCRMINFGNDLDLYIKRSRSFS